MKLLLSFILVFFASCTIYRSPDRKDFESESSQFRTQNLTKTECRTQSVRSLASASRLITILRDPRTDDSEFLWEYRIDDKPVFESDNLKGAYCVFENN